MFVPVANELMENGYFTYEEGTLQALRLTEKGREYIYNPSAELDCCHENQSLTLPQAQYLDNWHKSFQTYIKNLFAMITAFEMLPQTTEADKQGLQEIKLLLAGKDVMDVESELSKGVVQQSTLDKIEKLNKNLVDVAVEHLQTDLLVKEFLRQLFYLKIAQDKKAEELRLSVLKIKI